MDRYEFILWLKRKQNYKNLPLNELWRKFYIEYSDRLMEYYYKNKNKTNESAPNKGGRTGNSYLDNDYIENDYFE